MSAAHRDLRVAGVQPPGRRPDARCDWPFARPSPKPSGRWRLIGRGCGDRAGSSRSRRGRRDPLPLRRRHGPAPRPARGEGRGPDPHRSAHAQPPRARRCRYLPDERGRGIYFYAEPVGSPYTDENAYWVTVTPGPTMSARPAPPAGLLATSFTETVHREEDQYPLPVYFRDPERDFWVWDYLYAGYDGVDARSFTIRADGRRRVRRRVADRPPPRRHRQRARRRPPRPGPLQRAAGGRGAVGRARPFDIEFPVASGSVLEGDNVVELRAVLDAGVAESLLYVDSFDLTYERRYQAVDDVLSFTAATGTGVAVGGFSGPEVMLFDVTLPSRPVLVTGYRLRRATAGTRCASARRGPASRRYQALLPGRAKSPAAWRRGRTPACAGGERGGLRPRGPRVPPGRRAVAGRVPPEPGPRHDGRGARGHLRRVQRRHRRAPRHPGLPAPRDVPLEHGRRGT